MRKKLTSLLICGIVAMSTYAQDGLLESWAVGVDAGSYGFGVQGATSLSPNVKARVGFNYLTYTHNKPIGVDMPRVGGTGEHEFMRGEFTPSKLTLPNTKLMFDYYPSATGIFCITAGVYMGNNNIYFNGEVYNYSTDPDYVDNPQIGYEDIYIQPNLDGTFEAKLKLGNSIKPYFGIGLGKTIPDSGVSLKFELGLVSQASTKIESKNASPAVNGAYKDFMDQFDSHNLPVSKGVLKTWPVINFTLSYRIK